MQVGNEKQIWKENVSWAQIHTAHSRGYWMGKTSSFPRNPQAKWRLSISTWITTLPASTGSEYQGLQAPIRVTQAKIHLWDMHSNIPLGKHYFHSTALPGMSHPTSLSSLPKCHICNLFLSLGEDSSQMPSPSLCVPLQRAACRTTHLILVGGSNFKDHRNCALIAENMHLANCGQEWVWARNLFCWGPGYRFWDLV